MQIASLKTPPERLCSTLLTGQTLPLKANRLRSLLKASLFPPSQQTPQVPPSMCPPQHKPAFLEHPSCAPPHHCRFLLHLPQIPLPPPPHSPATGASLTTPKPPRPLQVPPATSPRLPPSWGSPSSRCKPRVPSRAPQASQLPPRRPLPGTGRTASPQSPAPAKAPPSPRTPQVELAVADGVGVLRRLLDQLRRQLHHPARLRRVPPRRPLRCAPLRTSTRPRRAAPGQLAERRAAPGRSAERRGSERQAPSRGPPSPPRLLPGLRGAGRQRRLPPAPGPAASAPPPAPPPPAARCRQAQAVPGQRVPRALRPDGEQGQSCSSPPQTGRSPPSSVPSSISPPHLELFSRWAGAGAVQLSSGNGSGSAAAARRQRDPVSCERLRP